MKRPLQTACLLLCLFLCVPAHAQLSPEAQEALRRGKTAAAQALNTYEKANPDQPFWETALAYGEEAERLAPGAPEPQRFLAQVYTSLGWFKRAYDAWVNYERYGGELDADATLKYAQMGMSLGYSRYNQGYLREALGYYQKADAISSSDQTLTWLALINFELSNPQAALPYWQEVTRRQPDNPLYALYLERTQEQLRHGVEASNAFYEGLNAYNRGALDEALNAFARAATLNPAYQSAVERAGTLSLALGRSRDAVIYWQRAAALAPESVQAQENLALARMQVRWGAQATASYRDGLRLLDQGSLDAARDAFEQAAVANNRFTDAWAQLGGLERELGNLDEALRAFERAAVLEPAQASYQRQADALQAQLAQTELAQVEATRVEATQTEPPPQTPEPTAPQPAPDTAPTVTVTDPPATTTITATGEVKEDITADIPITDTPATAAASEAQATPEIQATPANTANQQVNGVSPDMDASGSAPLTLLGATFTHYNSDNKQEAAFSFFETLQSLTFDFQEPLDYASGTLHQRLEVLSKPSDAVAQYQVCLVPADDITVAPACSDPSKLTFNERGTFEASQPLSTLSNYDKVDWRKGVANILLILRDDNGNPVSSNYLYRSNPTLDFGDFYPMQVSYSAVIVPESAVFTGWPEQLSDR